MHKNDKQTRSIQFVRQILALPRITRILIAAILALATTLAVSPVIDELYIRWFYTEESAIVPSLITAAFGFAMYFVGWQLIVGTPGEENAAKSAIVWYFLVGFLALIVVGLWLLRLVTLGNASLS